MRLPVTAVVVELKTRLNKLFTSLGLSRSASQLHVYTFHELAIRVCGNAALEGARQFIMENDMSRLERIISDTKVIDISSNERYQDMYLNNVLFEEK